LIRSDHVAIAAGHCRANTVPLPDRVYTRARNWVQEGRSGSVFDGEAKVGITIDELVSLEARQ
jgi:hypothetical protein